MEMFALGGRAKYSTPVPLNAVFAVVVEDFAGRHPLQLPVTFIEHSPEVVVYPELGDAAAQRQVLCRFLQEDTPIMVTL